MSIDVLIFQYILFDDKINDNLAIQVTAVSEISNIAMYKSSLYVTRHLASFPPQAQEEAIRMGRERLQMPPFMKAREDKWEVIADDTEIAGHDVINHVFTDITFGLNERVRPDGFLLKNRKW